jgi:hypothetical protein
MGVVQEKVNTVGVKEQGVGTQVESFRKWRKNAGSCLALSAELRVLVNGCPACDLGRPIRTRS